MAFFKFNNHIKYVFFSYLTIGINILNSLIMFPLILKNMGLKELGVFGLFFSLKSIIDIGIGWLSGSIIKNLISLKKQKNTITAFSIVINISYGLVGMVIFLIYGFFQKNNYLCSVIFFSIFILLSFTTIPFYEVLVSELKQHQAAFFRFFQQVLFFLFAMPLLLFFNTKNLYMVFVCLSLSVFFNLIALIYYYFKNFYDGLSFRSINKALAKKLLIIDGSKFFFNGLTTILLLQIDVLIIDLFYGSEAVGRYLIIWKIPNTLIMLGWKLSEPLQAIVSNKLEKKEYKNLKINFFINERKILTASLLASLGYFLCGKYVLDFWIGIENVPDIPFTFLTCSIVIFLSITQRLYFSYTYFTEKIRLTTYLQLIEILFKIVFILLIFNFFEELSSVIGWSIGLLFTLSFYRMNSIRVIHARE